MTRLEELEKELEKAKEVEKNPRFTYSGAFYAHSQYIGTLIDLVYREKEKNQNDNLSKNT